MIQRYLLLFCLGCTAGLFPCTTFLVTKGASTDGSILVGHSDDNELADERIVYVPARDYPEGAKRPIYLMGDGYYPRLVAPDGPEPYRIGGKPTRILGYIDQARHTYAYFDGLYGIMNEHQLAIGECTNSTYFYQDFDSEKRIMSIRELSDIALERCANARDAILLMGSLAEQYGYYDFGETLLVADKEEGWVFEITSTPEGTSALWVAKKVPDGEVFVAANQFRIREVIPNDPDMLYSSNLFQVAKKQNWWNSTSVKPLDWLRCVCPGEFDHPYYSLRRVWRVFSRINPSLQLSPWVNNPYTKAYPFSIKPEKKLTLQDAMALFRDHYEGTAFDQSVGLASGPYGLTSRYLGSYDTVDFPDKRTQPLSGAWERPVSIYYTGYTYINQVRGDLPDPVGGVVWIGFDNPYNTCFMPLYAGVKGLPRSMQYGSPQQYDETFIFWPFNIVSNWISLYQQVVLPDVVARQKEIEGNELAQQADVERQALELYRENPKRAQDFLTQFCSGNVEDVVQKWWDFAHFLMEKYNAGFINKPKPGQKMGMPEKWRNQVGYQDGPVRYRKKGSR